MPIDAGSISSSVRIKLSQLNADIIACKTAFDNLGTEFTEKAEKYSTLGGTKYKNTLKVIAAELKNVEGAMKAGALSEGQAVERLIEIRKRELQVLQDKAVKEGMASGETVAAIRKTEDALSALEQKEKLLSEGGATGGGFFSTFAKMRDVMLGPVGMAKEIIGVFQGIISKADELENAWGEHEEALAKLNSVIKSTGAESWTSMQHLTGVAESLQEVTTYGDDTIETMQGVLLGFRNITGKNFDEATKAALDMATIMKMDLTSAAQTVGKALDNPVLGLDSLSRQGFKFTQTEKDMMKAMVEAGNLAGAQQIILDELAKTYGGASVAVGETATGLKVRLKNAIGDVNEEIGRSISTNLTPWRQFWLDIATNVAKAAQAHNDYRDAIAKEAKGTLGIEDYNVLQAAVEEKISKKNKEYEETKEIATRGDIRQQLATKARVVALEDELKKLNDRRNALIDGRKALEDSAERGKKASEDAIAQAQKTAAAEKEASDEFAISQQKAADSLRIRSEAMNKHNADEENAKRIAKESAQSNADSWERYEEIRKNASKEAQKNALAEQIATEKLAQSNAQLAADSYDRYAALTDGTSKLLTIEQASTKVFEESEKRKQIAIKDLGFALDRLNSLFAASFDALNSDSEDFASNILGIGVSLTAGLSPVASSILSVVKTLLDGIANYVKEKIKKQTQDALDELDITLAKTTATIDKETQKILELKGLADDTPIQAAEKKVQAAKDALIGILDTYEAKTKTAEDKYNTAIGKEAAAYEGYFNLKNEWIKGSVEVAKDAYDAEVQAAKDAYDSQVKIANDAYDTEVRALKKKQDDETRLLNKSQDKELASLDIAKQAELYGKGLTGPATEAQYRREILAAKEKNDLEKVAELQKELDILLINEKYIQLRKELEEKQRIEDLALSESHNDTLEKMADDHQKALKKLSDDHNTLIEDMADKHNTKLALMAKTHNDLIVGYTKTKNEAIDEIEKQQVLDTAERELKKVKIVEKGEELKQQAIAKTAIKAAIARRESVESINKLISDYNVFNNTSLPLLPTGLHINAAAAEYLKKLSIPYAATGGIVLPRDGGTLIRTAENKNPELLLNNSPEGLGMIRSFAQAIVEEMRGASGGSETIIIQSILNGQKISEDVVKRIDDGKVRFNKK